jgi:hypothetical protein
MTAQREWIHRRVIKGFCHAIAHGKASLLCGGARQRSSGTAKSLCRALAHGKGRRCTAKPLNARQSLPCMAKPMHMLFSSQPPTRPAHSLLILFLPAALPPLALPLLTHRRHPARPMSPPPLPPSSPAYPPACSTRPPACPAPPHPCPTSHAHSPPRQPCPCSPTPRRALARPACPASPAARWSSAELGLRRRSPCR